TESRSHIEPLPRRPDWTVAQSVAPKIGPGGHYGKPTARALTTQAASWWSGAWRSRDAGGVYRQRTREPGTNPSRRRWQSEHLARTPSDDRFLSAGGRPRLDCRYHQQRHEAGGGLPGR